MKILHVDPTTQNVNDLNNDISKNNNHAFILYYMVGCGPCEMARPEWKKIEDILGDKIKETDIIIADINQEILQNSDLKPKYLTEQNISINGFPTIHYISENGKLVEEYEGPRTADAFKKWIESKKKMSGGGKRRKRTKSKRSKKRTLSKRRTKSKRSKRRTLSKKK
jgi:thiol-disulfide isomerase/thioredoxin